MSCLTLLCILQTKRHALWQVKEGWLGECQSCFSQGFSSETSFPSATQSARQGLTCLLDFHTGGPMDQGRNKLLDKEHISPFLWLLPECGPDVAGRSVGSLSYEMPSLL